MCSDQIQDYIGLKFGKFSPFPDIYEKQLTPMKGLLAIWILNLQMVVRGKLVGGGMQVAGEKLVVEGMLVVGGMLVVEGTQVGVGMLYQLDTGKMRKRK